MLNSPVDGTVHHLNKGLYNGVGSLVSLGESGTVSNVQSLKARN